MTLETLAGDDKVVVVGQGYVGLPLAMRAVEVVSQLESPDRLLAAIRSVTP